MGRGKKLSLTSNEFLLAVAIAFMGFMFSTRTWLLFLNGLSPFSGLVVYYVVLYASLAVLSKMGLVVFGFRIKDPMQTLGLMMITFSFFVVVNWSSQWVQYVTTGSYQGVSVVFLQSEDGAIWSLWSNLLPLAGDFTIRILSFVVSPFLLTVTGSYLVQRKVKLP